MVKIIAIFFLAISCFGATATQIATGIVGNADPKIENLFGKNSDYIDAEGDLDISKISETLKINSLLKLSYKNEVKFDLKFKSKNAPLLLIKIIRDALIKLGYRDILITEFFSGNEVLYSIRVNSKFILDPGSLYLILKQTDTIIKSIKKISDFGYFYELDLSKTNIKNSGVDIGATELPKPLEPYVIDISGANKATIEVKEDDHWVATVRILDKELNLMQERRNDEETKRIGIDIPKTAKYIFIDDKNSLENIKRGLKIYLE